MHQFHPLYIEFCSYFNGNQDYFECHEVLEEYWKDIAPGNKQHVLVGLIQLAVGMYHWRRHNFNGATTMLQKSQQCLQENRTSPFLEAIDLNHLVTQIQQTIQQTATKQPFQAFLLRITDPLLQRQVNQTITSFPKQDAYFLTHKHTLRDRSDIIKARRQKIKK